MTIPPFPSQDLAKLVLGYLAEEQLMTAYDEFLQASPYLDALRNEYDRIFMTSLKNILAEYRAVKIYVDTCKPFALRKKIFQYTNLLDIVKFLVTNVDINKIQLQEATEKSSLEKQNITITPKPNPCEVCNSSKLPSCVCKCIQTDAQLSESASARHVEASTLQSSVETTPLADLPGNHVTTRKKHVKVLEKDCMLVDSVTTAQSSDSSAKQSFASIISPEEYLASCEDSAVMANSDINTCLSLNSTVKATDPSKSKQNIEEFNNVLKSVVNRNKTLSNSECPPNQRIPNANTLQDVASGGSSGESQSATYNVPDSSTSENLNYRATITKDLYNDSTKGPPQCQLLLQVSHVNDNIEIQTCRGEVTKALKPTKSAKLSKLQPKTIDKKIQIISDIKMGSKYSDKNNETVKKKLSVPINATSTPLMEMQTIMINGMPAYKHTPKYTKDEIMAMPTLIVMQGSGSSQIPTSAHCESIMTQNSVVARASSTPSVLEPLVIDVPPVTALSNKPIVTALPDLSEHNHLDSGLVKTVDFKNASLPKDNVISVETNTPQVLPPTRKSSSTPRRSSHIRVLDFTTPRRILHETINEQVSSQTSEDQSDPALEIILSSSPNLITQTTSEIVVTKSDVTVIVNEEKNHNDSGSAKENDDVKKAMKARKYDWDADLRALIANDRTDSVTKRTPKPKTSKKKKSTNTIADSDKVESKKKIRPKKSPKVKKTKVRRKIEDDEPPPDLDKNNGVPCKPTINIISGDKHEKIVVQEVKNDFEGVKNKPHDKDEEYIETPETERLSLQNVIGAKLNISDLLETPYKQALYDIQMETPKFLGPDLPGDPLSDIKIMNIPTPRFLNTPKPVEATPSSYSSRPTDYSSGGSYYKPDDQDYMPYPDFITCPVTSSKEDLCIEKSTENISDNKKTRPVRQCTKNVSYYRNTSVANKTKDVEDNKAASSCSDTISLNSSFEFENRKDSVPKTPRESQQLSKTEARKRNSTSCRKRKSPKDSSIRDKTKSFMKIKPRYTPKKEVSCGRNRIKNIPSPRNRGSPCVQGKRAASKEKLSNATPTDIAVPTKSRRKSSTPRKLHCTKTFNSESSGHDSPETASNTKHNCNREKTNSSTHGSNTEQLARRWSNERSQDDKGKDISTNTIGNEVENITKIKEFINSSDVAKPVRPSDGSMQENINKHVCIETDGTLQRDLMRRGFDLETAKIIERDLLDETPLRTETTASRMLPISVEIIETNKDGSSLEKTDTSITNDLEIVQDEMDDDVIELSVHECNEATENYFVLVHDDTKEITPGPPIKLKDNFTMEICLDPETAIRLKPSLYISNFDEEPPMVDEIDYSYKETELAVSSISNMDRLYTPLKDSIKSQCYEIFDSTLTSIDTPLKATSPVKTACGNSAKGLLIEAGLDAKNKTGAKKRKRLKSADETSSGSKRTKPDADLLLKTANIQNIDIETVLTKLHGH